MSSKRITLVLGTLLVAFMVIIGYRDAVRTWQTLQEQEQQIETLNEEFNQLNDELDDTRETKEQSQEEVEKLELEKKELEKKKQELERQLQAKRDAEMRLAQASQSVINAATNTGTVNASGAMSGCGDNKYAAYIYGMESGGRVPGNCDTTAENSLKCYGIGQACPGSKLPCDADYACQNAWFTNYAIERYGSWEKAYNFHVENGWW